MHATYSIHEFAKLAGVTVKALRHYDRLGLLKPGREGTGRYRRYREPDLERLEQIVALKLLGVPLKEMLPLLEGRGLVDALRVQRRAIEEKQRALDRAARVLRAAEEAMAMGAEPSAAMLRKLIEVIQMRESVEAMKKYYSEIGWERRRKYFEEGPGEEWRRLYRDIGDALEEAPESQRAQALADRWFDLSLRAWEGEAELQTDSPMAWRDRENWPEEMKRRAAGYRLEEVHAFIERASRAVSKKYFSDAAWTRFEAQVEQRAERFGAWWQARVDLFAEVEKSLQNPQARQALAERWRAQIEESGMGDREVREALERQWADRANWGRRLRWQFEGIYMMPYERILRCGEFLDAACERV